MPDHREVLEAKYDELDAQPEETTNESAAPEPVSAPVTTPAEPVEATPSTDTRPRDESGRFAPKEEAPKGISPKPAPIGTKPAEPVTPPPVAAPVTKAPQAWKPAAREEWAKIPAGAQQEILRLELDTKRALERAALAEKSQAGLESLTRPYEAVIRQTGMDAPKYVANLLQTAYSLSTAHPQQRAQTLADLVVQFGVSPADLDSALVARIQGHQAQPPPQQPMRDPRFDQFLQEIEQVKAQNQQKAVAEAEQTAESFATGHEFLNDVRDEMADILEVWSKRGKKDVTPDDLERAYNIACQQNPDVAPIFEQRRAAQEAQKAMASTARSRAAASSVRSEPTAPLAATPAGRREVLEARWDEMKLG